LLLKFDLPSEISFSINRCRLGKMDHNKCCLCSYEALDGDHLEDHIVKKHSDIFKNDETNKSLNG